MGSPFGPMGQASAPRRYLGVAAVLLAVFLALARLSFDMADLEIYTYPAQRPAANLCGVIGAQLAGYTLLAFGEAFWILPLACLFMCHRLLHAEKINAFSNALSTMFALPVLSLCINALEVGHPVYALSHGGAFGHIYGGILQGRVGPVGVWIVLSTCLLLLLVGFDILDFIRHLRHGAGQPRVFSPAGAMPGMPSTAQPNTVSRPAYEPAMDSPAPIARREPEEEAEVEEESQPEPRAGEPARKAPTRVRSHKAVKSGNMQLPPITLLNDPVTGSVDSNEFLKQRGAQLEQMFANFGIGCRVIGMERGPSITQFEMVIDEGIKVNKITGLSDNIALTLKSPSVRVVAPIPGRNTIGIEVPNIKKEQVNLRSIMESPECSALVQSMKLPLLLGKDVAGAPLVCDLSKMPHLLVAGTTGSGKSVCINSIIISLIFYHKPDYVKFIMIDPKMVEMNGYQDIPHLMTPVITDMNLAAGALEWACKRMDERYAILMQFRVRDIQTFNQLSKNKILEGLKEGESIDDIEWPMPYIVVVVDEFSDLMMVGAKEIEAYITRLAQKSRAVGIHVILATQRPSVDVITGLIKTNMPSRIAFQVAAKIDSRTILDANGADKLLGRGDMLFMPPGSPSLVRAQGVMVTDGEISKIVDFWKAQMPPRYIDMEAVPLKSARGGKSSGGSYDVEDDSGDEEYFQKAVEVVLDSGRPSASFIQRQLKVGYNKASRLIEMMEERGIVSPAKGSKGRDILMTKDQWLVGPGGGAGPGPAAGN